jgi:DNA-binding CsgD family transcriptional regulator
LNKHEGTSTYFKGIHDIIQEVEDTYFIGRKEELKFFYEYLETRDPEHRIIHFYGSAGIGKTFLLQKFARIAASKHIPFLHLDAHDFPNTSEGLFSHFQASLRTYITTHELDFTPPTSLESSIRILNELDETVIIVIDSYEQMADLDRWYRDTLLRYLRPNFRVILAGRRPLTGEWVESPAWRKITKQIQIQPFTYEDTALYLQKNSITNEMDYNAIWQFTSGNPLLLSLSVTSKISSQDPFIYNSCSDLFGALTKRWLSEVTNERLFSLIEVAALFHKFDQHLISTILEQEIPNKKFNQLTSLSFVHKTREGWSIQEIIRDAIRVELKQRNPDRYESLTKKIIHHYYQRIVKQPTKEDISSFFYHIGDNVLQSVFFQDTPIDSSLYLEPIGEYNFEEVEDFFAYLKENVSVSKTNFYNRTSNLSFQFNASKEHNKQELELIEPDYIRRVGYDGSNLLKRKNGEVIGISIVVPIHEGTLPLLEEEPVSRAYFKSLTEKEKRFYQVQVDQAAGYFIRLQEYKDPSDISARATLLYSLFPLIYSGGRLIASTPLKFFQDLLYKFGFRVVPNAEHYDFKGNEPTPTFILDVSGNKLIPYLNHFLQDGRPNNELEVVFEEFSLTKREQEIVKLVVEGKTILEMANELFLAEITVKKALTRIYQKANVKNKIQLTKRIMQLLK